MTIDFRGRGPNVTYARRNRAGPFTRVNENTAMTTGSHSKAFGELIRLMELEPLEVNLFRGVSRDIGTNRVFGGQILAQALLAASQTVEGRTAHSLHGYFLRAGDHTAPVVYIVDRTRDGRSFSSRRVMAVQHGEAIFTFAASFQLEEEGIDHQFEMPDVPSPEDAAPIEGPEGA